MASVAQSKATLDDLFRTPEKAELIGGRIVHLSATGRKPNRVAGRIYGQRWQAESVFSRDKRRFGSALRARRWANQKKEIQLKALTHNLLLL
jgi:transposase